MYVCGVTFAAAREPGLINLCLRGQSAEQPSCLMALQTTLEDLIGHGLRLDETDAINRLELFEELRLGWVPSLLPRAKSCVKEAT